MTGLAFRDAVDGDLPLLASLAADFGQGHHDSPALREWMDPEWDFGFVAIDESGQDVGAAWWRAFRAVTDGSLNEELREPFLGVVRSHRGRGFGTALLRALIERARGTDIRMLVARIAEGPQEHQIQQMISSLDFIANEMYRSRGLGTFWQLDVAD